jgi:hypothetical protein
MQRLLFAPSAVLFAFAAVAACKGSGSGSESASDTGGGGGAELEFAGEQPFLPGLDVDTGWLPDGSPVAVRATASATGQVAVVANATSDGETLTPVAGSGSLSLEGALGFEVSARIDTNGIMYEGIVDSFEYGIEPANQGFDPFALDAPITVMSALPAQELGKVPIPSVPGASLVMSVTGGDLTTSFQGTCAEARDGFAQYVGTITMAGTVACAATVEIEIPIVGTQTFGPFPFDVPIPAIESPTDLGTLSLDTGEPGAAMGICDGSSTATDDGSEADDTAGDDVADDGTGDASSGDDDVDGGTIAETGDGTGEDDDTGTNPGDPSYPEPDDSGCPDGSVAVGFGTDPPNVFCSPPCAGSACPAPATGEATPFCAFNPDSSYIECASDIDCVAPEFCDSGVCALQPSHCALACDDVGMVCPDEMTCLGGVCSYLQ